MTGLFTPELSDAPGEVFSLDAAVSAAVVVVEPGFATEDFVSDVLPGPDKESSASVVLSV